MVEHWYHHYVVHLIILGFASNLLCLFCLLLVFSLGGPASVPVGPARWVPLLGPHSHTQPVVGRFAVFIGVGGPSDGTWRMSVKAEGEEGTITLNYESFESSQAFLSFQTIIWPKMSAWLWFCSCQGTNKWYQFGLDKRQKTKICL